MRRAVRVSGARIATRQAVKVAELGDQFMRDYALLHKRSAVADRANLENHIVPVIPQSPSKLSLEVTSNACTWRYVTGRPRENSLRNRVAAGLCEVARALPIASSRWFQRCLLAPKVGGFERVILLVGFENSGSIGKIDSSMKAR
jgi:hypothetical protein